jgi:hypothetical protein
MVTKSTGDGLRGWCCNYAVAYIGEIGDHPMFNTVDFVDACTLIHSSLADHPKNTISIILDLERKEPLREPGCNPQLHVNQYRPVIRILFEIREGRVPTEADIPEEDELVDAIQSVVTATDDIAVHPSRSGLDLGGETTMEHETRTLPISTWTRRQLRKLP